MSFPSLKDQQPPLVSIVILMNMLVDGHMEDGWRYGWMDGWIDGCWMDSRDVMINCELVENRFIYVMIQIDWDAQQIAIQLGVGVYMNVCLRGTYCL